jgi:ankyrin repeat protein
MSTMNSLRSLTLAAACFVPVLAFAAAPAAEDFFRLIHDGNDEGLRRLIKDGADVKIRDSHKMAPLHYAASFGNAGSMRILLESGADVNARNAQEGTALVLSGGDEAKTRLLVEKGADVNAASKSGRTALMAAAGRNGGDAMVRFLIEKGADAKFTSPTGVSPLHGAAAECSLETVRLLVEKGADVNATSDTGNTPLMAAAQSNRVETVKFLLSRGAKPNVATITGGRVKNGPIALVKLTPLMLGAPYGSPELIRALIDGGAKVNARDIRGMTALMLAVASETQDVRVVKILLDAKTDVNVKDNMGDSALDWARKFGNPEVIHALEAGGAKGQAVSPAPVRSSNNPPLTPARAVQQSVALLERTNTEYFHQGACFGCHHQGTSAQAEKSALTASLTHQNSIAREQASVVTIQRAGEPALLQLGGAGIDGMLYSVQADAAAGLPGSRLIEAQVNVIAARQNVDGSWTGFAPRAPIQASNISRTTRGLRALQLYGWPARRAEFEGRVAKALEWLRNAKPTTSYERADLLLGLYWAGANSDEIRRVAKTLLAEQRDDGGWSQNRYLSSDAYATGLAMDALHETKNASPSDDRYRRGVEFLLRTQLDDGSWYVRSRAVKLQPYFQSGFPHDHDQWISTAATSFAVRALVPAAEAAISAAR